MTVFVVLEQSYETDGMVGVFASEALAKACSQNGWEQLDGQPDVFWERGGGKRIERQEVEF